MEGGSVKGTVTSISSVFSAEEARKAVKRVQDTIADRQKELDQLREFIADNTNLVKHVQRLPDELHHDIMVPFGKAAFFPGRLIHTNEFLVLLGEGHYAERTSKQTVEILKRRGKILESQVESLKTMMLDLKTEASFFDATASEAAEGLVEIREDYNEEETTGSVSKTGPLKSDSRSSVKANDNKVTVEDENSARKMFRLELDEHEKQELAAKSINEQDGDENKVEDEEFSQLMSRLEELEKQELEDESKNLNELDGDEPREDENKVEDAEFSRLMSRLEELEKQELEGESLNVLDGDEHSEVDLDSLQNQNYLDQNIRNSKEYQSKNPQQKSDNNTDAEELLRKTHYRQGFADQINFEGSTVQPVSKDEVSHAKSLTHNVNKSNSAEKELMPSEVKKKKVTGKPTPKHEVPAQTYQPETDSLKAFTCSIVEHTHNLQMNPREQPKPSSQSPDPQPSKPVSRFKMQRR